MTDSYDAAINSRRCHALAIAAMREGPSVRMPWEVGLPPDWNYDPATGMVTTVQDGVWPLPKALILADMVKSRSKRGAMFVEDRQRIEHIDRGQDCERRLLAGETLESIGQSWNISRERVRQIVEQRGVVNPRHVIAKRRQSEAADRKCWRQAEHAAWKSEREQRLQGARNLVEKDGWSIRRALDANGFDPRQGYYLAKGWDTKYGRWRSELQGLRAYAVALWQEGLSLTEIYRRDARLTRGIVRAALAKAGISGPYRRHRLKSPAPLREWRYPLFRAPRASVTQHDWTSDQVATLASLWFEGKSAAEIAAVLGSGLTRNSVIGKIYRLRKEGKLTALVKGATGKTETRMEGEGKVI